MKLKSPTFVLSAALALAILTGCASMPKVLEPMSPTLTFKKFNSVAITPQGVKFEVDMEIKNNMPITLPVSRMDYTFEINHKPLVTGSYDRFDVFSGRHRQVVSFPFILTWENLVAQVVSKSKNASYQAAFSGTLFINTDLPFREIPFRIEKARPVPQLPLLSFYRTEGSPFGDHFTILLKLKNGNTFPITLAQADTRMHMNNQVYTLVQGQSEMVCGAGESQVISLLMTNTLGKGISMLANALINRKAEIAVDGDIIFSTPFGDLHVPYASKTFEVN